MSAHARFAEAAAAFDAIEHVRPVGAEFHRAQGNAHFFSGDIGRAVLAYRRGLELRPGDDRLAESLRVAREAVRTEATPSTQATLLNTLAHWRRFVSPVYVRAALVVSWCGLWAVLIVARFRRLRARSILIAVLGLIALITGAALGTDVWHRSDGSAVVVIAESPAYNGPSSAVYEQTFAAPLSPGVEAHAVESRLGWTRIRLRTGSETWIRTDTMSEVVPSS